MDTSTGLDSSGNRGPPPGRPYQAGLAGPIKTKKSPSPGFHAATKAARRELWEAYAKFVAAFREASEKLRHGDLTASFPVGSFPPGLPFVQLCPGPAP